VATDSTGADVITLPSALIKSGSAWEIGPFVTGVSNGGALDTGTVSINSWYHVYLIKRPDTGVVDVLVSLSATAPTLPTNYTLFRRIGTIRYSSGAWYKFQQDGDLFQWDTAVIDVAATNPGTSAVTRTLSTPPGIRTRARLSVGGLFTTPASDNFAAVLISDLSISDQSPSVTSVSSLASYSSPAQVSGLVDVMTNTSSQVRSRLTLSAAGTTLYITTTGWFDSRGRDV
jgi:hypothetical protein